MRHDDECAEQPARHACCERGEERARGGGARVEERVDDDKERALFWPRPQSFHDAKGIAGNIIPAIATTNAIVAAWQTQELLEMLKLMEPGPDGRLAPPADAPLTARCKLNSCSRDPSGNRRKRLFQPQPLDAPKPSWSGAITT